MRRRLLITGAAGGMGRACARLMGATHDLVLTDVATPALAAFADDLRAEGYTVAAVYAGDLGDAAVLGAVVAALSRDGASFAFVHAAGISPSMAGWRAIMEVNLVATAKLVAAIEPCLTPGSAGVLIASLAAHAPVIPGAQEILAEPLAPDFIDGIGALIGAVSDEEGSAASRLAYVLSKQAVLRIAERRAASWGAKGARLISISPGLILTPMGRKEADETPGAKEVGDAAPAGRPGTAMDVAMTTRFLLSDEAAFITGSDVKVDGGAVAAMKMMEPGFG